MSRRGLSVSAAALLTLGLAFYRPETFKPATWLLALALVTGTLSAALAVTGAAYVDNRSPVEGGLFVAIVGVLAVSWAVLAVAPATLRRLGHTGLNVLTRIMGLLIMVIGVQFVLDGARAFVASVVRP